MSNKFLDDVGLTYLWGKLKALLATKADKTTATATADGLMSAADKSNLDLLVGNIDGEVEIWDVTGTATSGSTVTITGHTSTPYEDVATALSHNIMPILRFNDLLYFISGVFTAAEGDDDETTTRYTFIHHETYRRKIINVRANETVTYTYPAGGAPQFHQSTDTTYGAGTQSAYGHVKVVDNVTSSAYAAGEALAAHQGYVLKQAIDGKQASISGGASTITSSNLTANRALVSNGSGKVAVSAVTSTELGYLDGVTSAIQTQLNNKLNKTMQATSCAVISDGNGDIVGSETTAAQIAALRTLDTTSTVQTQIDGKAPTNHQSTGTDYGVATQSAYGHTKLVDGLTAAAYNAGEALSAYQGAILKGMVDDVTPTIPNIAATGAASKSVNSATATNAGSITLTPGLWLITVTARWNANATGYRQVWLSTSSTGSAKDYASIVSIPAVNGAITSEQLTVFASVASNTTWHIVAQQSSGSARTLDVRYSACRLGAA